MDADVARGVCESRDCEEPIMYAVRYDLIGAPEPAYACRRHARRSRSADVKVELLATNQKEVGDG